MPRTTLFAAALATVPLPAAADVTARYDLGKKQLSVEVDDSGDYRISYAGMVSVIHHAGKDYVVVEMGAQPVTMERAAVLAAAAKMLAADTKRPKAPDAPFVLSRGAEARVAGRAGTTWLLKPDKPDEKPLEMVMSADPALAPIGAAIRDTMVPLGSMFGTSMGAPSSFVPQWTALFAKGTPLQLGVERPQITLVSVDTADIAESRFALPGEVVSPDALVSMLAGKRGPGEPPAPAPLP